MTMTLEEAQEEIVRLQRELAVLRFHAKTNPPRLKPGDPQFFVLRQRETDPWEVAYFDNHIDAVACADYAGTQWTSTFVLVPLAALDAVQARLVAYETAFGPLPAHRPFTGP